MSGRRDRGRRSLNPAGGSGGEGGTPGRHRGYGSRGRSDRGRGRSPRRLGRGGSGHSGRCRAWTEGSRAAGGGAGRSLGPWARGGGPGVCPVVGRRSTRLHFRKPSRRISASTRSRKSGAAGSSGRKSGMARGRGRLGARRAVVGGGAESAAGFAPAIGSAPKPRARTWATNDRTG